MERENQVIIIGAGISGLIAALELHAKAVPFVILEAGAQVGGRVRTEEENGYQFDLGFQILLAAYPWAQEFLDLDQLDFRPVKSGALVWDGAALQRLVDPLRHPGEIAAALTSPLLTWGDRFRFGKLAAQLYPQEPRALLVLGAGKSTNDYLHELGFSESAIQSFLRPFFGGIFLEAELSTASSLFRFLFRVFGTGAAGLPARGMGAITRQLAAKLPRESIRLGARVATVKENSVYLESGEVVKGGAVICATDQSARRALVPGEFKERPWLGCSTLYFEAEASPVKENILVLNGSGRGVVNSVLCLTDVAPEYSKNGKALLSVSLLGISLARAAKEGPGLAKEELSGWFGPAVKAWKFLRHEIIPHALPAFEAGSLCGAAPVTAVPGVFAGGDYLTIPSQEGAARAGQNLARAAMEHLSVRGATTAKAARVPEAAL